jgi:hypothetical protein
VNPDSDICISDLQEVNKKLCFLLITFWRYIYIIFQRWNVQKSHIEDEE